MYIKNFWKLIKQNIRDYGMYIALVIIMIIFTLKTDGIFISSKNITNLLNQMGYIAVLAVGMTLIIVIRHIDLSVGFVAGFLGAVAAILLTRYNMPVFTVIPAIMILGIIIGSWNGFLVAQLGIPSFVTSLASMLIFRGALLQVTEGTGTIIIHDRAFNAIGNEYLPSLFRINGMHGLTLLLGLLAILIYIYNEIKIRKTKQEYKFEVIPLDMFITKLIFISAIISYITFIIAGDKGLSWTVIIVLAIVFLYNFITNKTVLGRHIYAVGGNPEAAQLSGINVKFITYVVFASMSLLAAISGILYTSRLQSATTTAGTLFELDAIAAAYVGGVSAAGGVGRVTGSIIGALVMASLTNGMNLMGVGIAPQYIVKGLVLVAAVVFDVTTRNRAR